ncbi:MAG: hypothetical protein ACI4EG_09365 [Fusicatenibacter sp.]|nr:hypothetical protein [Fusicatenibacter sp.]
MKERNPDQIMLLISIIENGKGRNLLKAYNEYGIRMHYQLHGEGTATSEIMDILGIGTSEKDILLSFAPAAEMTHLLQELRHDFGETHRLKGVAFLLALTAINQMAAFLIGFHQNKDHKGDEKMREQEPYTLILVAVDQGYTDEVMRSARTVGARGGTIVHGRWAGKEIEMPDDHGNIVQEEKEIVAIGVPLEKRNQLMEVLNREFGLRTKAHAVICSLGVDAFVRFG